MTDIYTSADADNDSAADGNDSEFLRFFLHFQLWQHLDSADFCCTFPKQTLATSTQLAPSSELSSRFLTNLQKHQNAKRVISIKCQKSNHGKFAQPNTKRVVSINIKMPKDIPFLTNHWKFANIQMPKESPASAKKCQKSSHFRQIIENLRNAKRVIIISVKMPKVITFLTFYWKFEEKKIKNAILWKQHQNLIISNPGQKIPSPGFPFFFD